MKLPKMTLVMATALFAAVLLGIFCYRVHPDSPAFPHVPEPSVSPDAVGRIDLNRADAETLMLLPGVGPELAERILQYRQDYGRFYRVDELENIRGFHPALIDRIRDYITIGGEP